MLHFVTTDDQSVTLYNSEVGEHYHSIRGALAESRHVFINMGLVSVLDRCPAAIRIVEVGFGTGLNFLLSADYCRQKGIKLDYCGIEAYPLPLEMVEQTGYSSFVDQELWNGFRDTYGASLVQKVAIGKFAELEVLVRPLQSVSGIPPADLLYFDAFAAVHQPELWTAEALEITDRLIRPGGTFVTYAITGHLKRTLKSLGYRIEKLKGAPGKREMLRATKSL